MGYYSNADDYLKYAKKNSMYKAEEKVITESSEHVSVILQEGDEFLKLKIGDTGLSRSVRLTRSEVIELIEKLAKVAEQLPK